MDLLENTANKQAFKTVKAHLLKQMSPALEGGVCQYRTSDGKKCAVGALIPDAEYNKGFDPPARENDTTYGCLDDVQQACPSLRPISFALLSDVRQIHDAHAPAEWAALLDTLEMELIRNNYQHDATIF